MCSKHFHFYISTPTAPYYMQDAGGEGGGGRGEKEYTCIIYGRRGLRREVPTALLTAFKLDGGAGKEKHSYTTQ